MCKNICMVGEVLRIQLKQCEIRNNEHKMSNSYKFIETMALKIQKHPIAFERLSQINWMSCR